MILMALIVWLRTVSGRVSLVRLKVKEAVVPGREDNMGMRTKASTITLIAHNRNLKDWSNLSKTRQETHCAGGNVFGIDGIVSDVSHVKRGLVRIN